MGNAGRPIERTFRGNKTDARKALAKLGTEAHTGKVGPATDSTVGDPLDDWLAHLERAAEPPRRSTKARRDVETRTRPRLGQTRLTELIPKNLDDAYGAWLSERLSASSIRRHAASCPLHT